MTAKKWNPGVADDAWKIIICARDAWRTDDIIGGLIYIIAETGADTERGISILRQMTGEEIVDALLKYKAVAYQSVAAALPKPPTST